MATRQALLLIQKFFERNSNGNISSARMSISLKFRILYQEHMTIEEVARCGHSSCCSPDIEIFRTKFNREYLDSQNLYFAEISNLYQERMTIEEVARYGHPSSSSPDTQVFRTKFIREYLESQNLYFAETSNFESGAYDNRGGGTLWPPLGLFSRYRCFSKEIQSAISREPEFLFLYDYEFCIRIS